MSDPRLSHVFSEAQRLARTRSIEIGMPAPRRSALKELAEAAAVIQIFFAPFGTIEEAIAKFREIPGVGEWTAQYIALRALRETDAFPAADIGLLRGAEALVGARSPALNLLARSESSRPWRAYTAQHLWAAGAATISESGALMLNVLNLLIDRIDTPSANCCLSETTPESYVPSTGLTTKNACFGCCDFIMERMGSGFNPLTILMV